MPYVTRKKTKLLYERPFALKVDLADDKLPRHYLFDSGIRTFIRGKATFLVDKNDHVKCSINRNFRSQIFSEGHYVGSGSRIKVAYDRWFMLPKDLVDDFAIDVDYGVELVLNEVESSGEVEKIFSQRMEQGSMDFEPKGLSEEIINSSESLVTTQFADDFYDRLASEINNAFNFGLFTATMVLVRKLFEKLVIDLLRQKYGMPQIQLFYSKQDDGFLSLSALIHNLGTKIDDFKPYDFFKLDREKEGFLKFLWNVKQEGNASAHSIEPVLDRKEINDLKLAINKYSHLLVSLTRKVKDTP
jgi:hypothetical protein